MGYREFERGISSAEIKEATEAQSALERAQKTHALWTKSERILNILRTISPLPVKLEAGTMARWIKSISSLSDWKTGEERMLGHLAEPTIPTDPNDWFETEFPKAHSIYGPAFFGTDSIDSFRPRFIPETLNTDFFASILGGNEKLGHQVVWNAVEDRFYFYDVRVDAFCSTTEEKLQILLSNYLIRCAEDCRQTTDTSLLTGAFRKPKVLQSIVKRAKSMHQACSTFFEGKNAKVRIIEGRLIDPRDTPSHEKFVRQVIKPEPDASLSVHDAFSYYRDFCSRNGLSPASRIEFKKVLAEVIREEFDLGVRHDLISDTGKMTQGWKGIACISLPMEFSRS